MQRLVAGKIPGCTINSACGAGWERWERSVRGAEVVHRGRLSTELHVLVVCLTRAAGLEGCVS